MIKFSSPALSHVRNNNCNVIHVSFRIWPTDDNFRQHFAFTNGFEYVISNLRILDVGTFIRLRAVKSGS